MNGKLRKHTRNNAKNHKEFLRNENSELQSQVSKKQPVRAVTKAAGATCTAITPSANAVEEQN